MPPDLLSLPTLVLNRNWTPLQTTTSREAICLVSKGSAKIVDPETYVIHDLDSWSLFSRQNENDNLVIRSLYLALLPPDVIVLHSYSGRGVVRRGVSFSKRNILRRDGFACQFCGDKLAASELTVDHVLPRSRGGGTTWENCVAACYTCNSMKGCRTPREAGMELRRRPTRPERLALWEAEETPTRQSSVIGLIGQIGRIGRIGIARH